MNVSLLHLSSIVFGTCLIFTIGNGIADVDTTFESRTALGFNADDVSSGRVKSIELFDGYDMLCYENFEVLERQCSAV